MKEWSWAPGFPGSSRPMVVSGPCEGLAQVEASRLPSSLSTPTPTAAELQKRSLSTELQKQCSAAVNSAPSPCYPLRRRRRRRSLPVSELVPLRTTMIEDSPQVRFHTKFSSAHRGGRRCSAALPCASPLGAVSMPDASCAQPRPGLVRSSPSLTPCAPAYRRRCVPCASAD